VLTNQAFGLNDSPSSLGNMIDSNIGTFRSPLPQVQASISKQGNPLVASSGEVDNSAPLFRASNDQGLSYMV
jgi:hypothetical protein